MQRLNRLARHSKQVNRVFIIAGIVLVLFVILSLVYAYHLRSLPAQRLSPMPGSHNRVIVIPAVTCTRPSHAAGDSTVSIQSGGLERTFIIHLSPSYGTQPQPLVISYHAYSFTAGKMEHYTNMAAEADKEGFIVVFPQGVDLPPSWNAGIGAQGPTGDADDVQFTRDMLSFLETNYCVDVHRIYVTGFSLGGGMAYRLACTLSDQVAAIATVAGAYYPIPGGCHPSRPVPVLEIHGQADHFAPYDGNPAAKMAAVQAYLNAWLGYDHCSGSPQVIFQRSDVTGIAWNHCAGGTMVEHYRVSDGGHTWPGASPSSALGYTTQAIDANSVIWDFFSRYSN